MTINDLIDSLSEVNAFCLISASLTLTFEFVLEHPLSNGRPPVSFLLD